ncbi:MAG: hypothetical protein HQK59_11695 [Deltaproteobacteria bacterium]|nr:hypothetical protein [Deltaproteobacteria bacterium]
MRFRIFIAVVIIFAAGSALAGATDLPCDRIPSGGPFEWGKFHNRCLVGQEHYEQALRVAVEYFKERVKRRDFSSSQDVIDFLDFVKDKRTKKEFPEICNIINLLIITKLEEYKDFCNQFGCPIQSSETAWPKATVPLVVAPASPTQARQVKTQITIRPPRPPKKPEQPEESNEDETPATSSTSQLPPPGLAGKAVGRLMALGVTDILLSFIAVFGVICILILLWIVWELTKLRKTFEMSPDKDPNWFNRSFKSLNDGLDRIEDAIVKQIDSLKEEWSQLVGSPQSSLPKAPNQRRTTRPAPGVNDRGAKPGEVIIPYGSPRITANNVIRVSTTTSSPKPLIEKIADALISLPSIKHVREVMTNLEKDGRIRSGIIGEPAREPSAYRESYSFTEKSEGDYLFALIEMDKTYLIPIMWNGRYPTDKLEQFYTTVKDVPVEQVRVPTRVIMEPSTVGGRRYFTIEQKGTIA